MSRAEPSGYSVKRLLMVPKTWPSSVKAPQSISSTSSTGIRVICGLAAIAVGPVASSSAAAPRAATIVLRRIAHLLVGVPPIGEWRDAPRFVALMQAALAGVRWAAVRPGLRTAPSACQHEREAARRALVLSCKAAASRIGSLTAACRPTRAPATSSGDARVRPIAEAVVCPVRGSPSVTWSHARRLLSDAPLRVRTALTGRSFQVVRRAT